MLADPALRDLLHRRPRTLSLPTGHAPIASGGSNSCRVGYLPPTGSTCPFHGARFLQAGSVDWVSGSSSWFLFIPLGAPFETIDDSLLNCSVKIDLQEHEVAP